ncbi:MULTISPECIES: DUF2625 family protein [Pseudomonas]|jgi:hypothetical protein|uniref:DUF2625 family protein n=1 Tax=Pseudomonas TaxID=286 RepID=UPI00087627B9|nr:MULTISPECIES: DUF2625 family protein [Pseudomonas]TFA85108.1 uncharacterized protein DUF2625 [Pseudomonas sp. LAIL14HWK12:I2]SCZ31806.1 Protein of unknown function DUF2625 [Pseudomonas sp. NFIX46]SDB20864.1 Protein of unknown function DUF2625 [Pseudomonas putida]SFQ93595.1 Protein of unknown function DUF2625 [Pseudomonas sp. NFIX49]
MAGILAEEILVVLRRRNGFYAFEGALHVFPSESSQNETGLSDWNHTDLWRSGYKGLADSGVFFAEDIFGGQFCIKDDKIYIFDPETGSLEYLAADIESWAQMVLNDYEVLTGYPLAHQWQKRNGPIAAGMRLLPKIPFVMGGEFSLDNLYVVNAIEGMRLRADIADKIKSLPNGTQVKYSLD